MIDIEAVLIGWLNSRIDPDVVSETPASRSQPWVRARQLDARNATPSQLEHLLNHLVQLDCYAGEGNTQEQAADLNGLVRDLLVGELPGQTVSGAVVVSSVNVMSNPRIPDEDFEPARQRYVLTVEVHAHAIPS